MIDPHLRDAIEMYERHMSFFRKLETNAELAKHLGDLARRIRLLERQAVEIARREEDQSWSDIGKIYGITAQGAFQRFSRRKFI